MNAFIIDIELPSKTESHSQHDDRIALNCVDSSYR